MSPDGCQNGSRGHFLCPVWGAWSVLGDEGKGEQARREPACRYAPRMGLCECVRCREAAMLWLKALRLAVEGCRCHHASRAAFGGQDSPIPPSAFAHGSYLPCEFLVRMANPISPEHRSEIPLSL